MKLDLNYLLATAIGVLGLMAAQQHQEASEANARVKSLEADVRTAVGQRLDAEERQSDEIEKARGEKAVELWKTQQELEQCKRDKK
jgi:hypothetical protein